ncbi:MAG TPA: HlyD family efflux transporter periplasmic adaptor subunit [Thermomicrobiales bacterium]|nr:HlyD family efflux transporter periplasmic adaptor subunit [Thermomicrobiales bacterium]
MAVANVIAVVAQPFQASYLCFEVGGILDRLYVDLGDVPKDIPFEKLCDPLRSAPVASGDPSRLQFDAAGIVGLAKPFATATLRSELSKAALDTAINTRQNIYFSKHANASAVISTIAGSYSRTSPASKPNFLDILDDIAGQQFSALSDAYMEDDRTGVVKATSSTVQTDTSNRGNSERGGNFTQQSVGRNRGTGVKLPQVLPPAWQGYETVRFTTTEPAATALTVGTNYEMARNNGTASGTQSALNVDYEYRTPYLETRARHARARISLIDQKFESYMFEQNIPYLQKIFKNELASIDNDVYQLQIALLRSFLISPIPGVVTGIYKNPGDAVSAGEPVLRVENNDVVRLVASLVHRGAIPVGATATVTTTLFGPSNPVTTLTGSVVAARGRGDGNQWEIVAQTNNVDGSGNHILPIGYYFDREYTQITIS